MLSKEMYFEKDYQTLHLGYCDILDEIVTEPDAPQINIIGIANKKVVEINKLQDQTMLSELVEEDISNLKLDLLDKTQPSNPKDLYNLETYIQ